MVWLVGTNSSEEACCLHLQGHDPEDGCDTVLQVLGFYRTERWYILEECNSTSCSAPTKYQ